MKAGSIILNWKQKCNPWIDTTLNFLGRKKLKYSLSVGKFMIMVFWHSERVINMDALPVRKTHLQCIHQDAERTLEACWWVGITKSPNRNLTSAGQCKCAHKYEDSGSHHKIWFDSVTPSTLQPWSSTLRFPSVWSTKGCNPQYKVWDWWWCDSCSENLTI